MAAKEASASSKKRKSISAEAETSKKPRLDKDAKRAKKAQDAMDVDDSDSDGGVKLDVAVKSKADKKEKKEKKEKKAKASKDDEEEEEPKKEKKEKKQKKQKKDNDEEEEPKKEKKEKKEKKQKKEDDDAEEEPKKEKKEKKEKESEDAEADNEHRQQKVAHRPRDQSDSKSKAFERVPGESSKEARDRQKQLLKERKVAKPLGQEVDDLKAPWERLRLKADVPAEERAQLIDQLYGIMEGRMFEFVTKHDAARVVQTMVKWGTVEQRRRIAGELKGRFSQLAESKYAKFLIGKLMAHDDDEIRSMIVPEFYGKVRRLINHAEASWILDDIYRAAATDAQKAVILREWYGTEFALAELQQQNDATPTAELEKIIEAEPSKRGPIMKYLFDMINSLVQKHMVGFTCLHDAMLQYFANTKRDTAEFNAFFDLVKGDESGDLLKNLAFTKPGSRLVCLLLAHGTAKDRKVLLKAYKDTIQSMSTDEHAHKIILTAYDVVDDTKMMAKAIFSELLGDTPAKVSENANKIVRDPNARTTLLYLLEGASNSVFGLGHRGAVELLQHVHELRNDTSKKDPSIRRTELVAAVSTQLIGAVTSGAPSLVRDAFGCQLVTDVLLDAIGDKSAALEAIAATAEGDPGAESDDASTQHVAQTTWGGRMLKNLVLGGKFYRDLGAIKPADPPLRFGDVLYPHIKEYLVEWATGPSSFVVVNLLDASDFSHRDELATALRKSRGLIERAATEETAGQRAAREVREAKEAKKHKHAKKKADGKVVAKVGNMGSKMILEKI